MLECENYAIMGLDADATVASTTAAITTTTTNATSDDESSLEENEGGAGGRDCKELGARITLYTQLNEQARKVFLRHASNRSLYVGCLYTFRDDLDFLYYFLGANPAMFQV